MKKKEWEAKKEKFMTDDEILEINDRISKLSNNKSDMGKLYSRWKEEEIAYKGDQEERKNSPNTRVNIINANIEGQVSALVEQNIAITTRGEGPSDEAYAEWARIGLDWTFRKNRIKRKIEVHERRRLKFGVGLFKVAFNEDAINKFGLAEIYCPPLNKIFIDSSIKDYLRYQESSYMAEAIRFNKQQFINMYGEEKTSIVNFGVTNIEDTTIFSEDDTMDDNNSATLVQWWERYEGKLRLLEFTGDGLLLYDSHKFGDRKDNQKTSQYSHNPYYKYVNNRYPFFFTPLYTEEGKLWGFGDSKLLMPIQDMINDLYDKIRMSAKPNLILFDPESEVELDDFDNNSYEPLPANLSEKKAIESVAWGQVNPALWQLLSSMHQEAQRVTRFSDLMIGQGRSSDTATEASIQQQQGNSTTDHKKVMLQETLIEVAEYCLGLMMEKYTEAKAFRISEDKSEFEWIDFRKLAKVPIKKPVTDAFSKKFMEKNPLQEQPEWELLMEDGKPMEKNIDLDIDISIGAGLPKNKTFLWQMIEKLAGLAVTDEMGQPKNIISYEELRSFIKDFLGLPLDKNKDGVAQPMMQQGMAQPQQPIQNANAPITPNGNPMLSLLPGGGR